MLRKKIGPALNTVFISVTALSVLISLGCVKKPVPLPEKPTAITSASELMLRVRETAFAVSRMDSSLNLSLAGVGAGYRGRFSGSLQMERRDGDQLAFLIQVYSIVGAPVLEVTSIGDRLEVYSPLDRTLFFNFTELLPDDSAEEFPISSFNEIALPLELLRDQIKVIWGTGFREDCRYEFADTGETYLLTEWSGEVLKREFEYSKSGPRLLGVKVYSGAAVAGGMEFSDHGAPGTRDGFIPRHMALYSEGGRMDLKLDQLRIDDEASPGEVSFKVQPHSRLILLTPPVP